MKPLKLSGGQKAKLLEMCKVLFPKYLYIIGDNVDCGLGGSPHVKDSPYIGDGFDFYIFFSEIKDAPYDDITPIHWFEFCMTHLSDELFERLQTEKKHQSEFRKDFLMNVSFIRDEGENFLWPPVDYLYKEFKKLNTVKK